MGNLKKTILPEEWELIKKEAQDPACSLSRLFDILRNRRAAANIQLLNRSWFLAFMMNCCGCKDGKIGTKFRIPVSAKKPEETPSVTVQEQIVTEKPEETPSVTETASESASDLLTPKTLFVLKWLYHNKTESFRAFYVIGGYQKKIATDAAAELENLGVITKKNAKRFEHFNWTQILQDFPEVSDWTDEHPEWKLKHRSKPEEETPSEQKTVVEDPIIKKMDAWLSDEPHVNGEITEKEVTEELRRLHVYDSMAAIQHINRWIVACKIGKVNGTSAYTIFGYTSPEESKEEISEMESLRRSLGFTPQHQTQQHRQEIRFQTGKFVIRLGNKDFEITNNSSSNVSLTIENSKVILVIK